jgi:hypothetical protein
MSNRDDVLLAMAQLTNTARAEELLQIVEAHGWTAPAVCSDPNLNFKTVRFGAEVWTSHIDRIGEDVWSGMGLLSENRQLFVADLPRGPGPLKRMSTPSGNWQIVWVAPPSRIEASDVVLVTFDTENNMNAVFKKFVENKWAMPNSAPIYSPLKSLLAKVGLLRLQEAQG